MLREVAADLFCRSRRTSWRGTWGVHETRGAWSHETRTVVWMNMDRVSSAFAAVGFDD